MIQVRFGFILRFWKGRSNIPFGNFLWLYFFWKIKLGRQWWAFNLPLSTSEPFLNAHIGLDDLGGHGKTFYFRTFILKFRILATRGKKSEMLTIFGHILAILVDFLTKLENWGRELRGGGGLENGPTYVVLA